jgi:hypothetical protein
MAIAVKPTLVGKKKLGPLGILPEFVSSLSIGAGTIDKLKILADFDMERERRIVMQEMEIDEYVSLVRLREFKRFFALELLYPNPDHSFVPSIEIDPFWHHLVLDSRRYVALCDKLYGGYVHHTPTDTCPGEHADNAGEKFGYTKSLLDQAFGGAPPAAWGQAAKCNHAACTWP